MRTEDIYELMCPVDMLLKAVACPLSLPPDLALKSTRKHSCALGPDFRLSFALKLEYVYEKHHMQHS